MSWSLQINGEPPVLFSELGCVELKRQLRSQTAGTFTFRLNVAHMGTDPIAGVNDLALVSWVDGTPIFAGRVTKVPLEGSPEKEDQTYEISDGWSDFERITFQQEWNVITGVDEEGDPTTAGQYSAECLLGIDINGNPENNGQVITDAVNWAVSCGAWCQLGTILVDADGNSTASPVPVDEVTDLPVAEIIKRMIRWTPDAVAWFDYSTIPPTFHVTRQAQCTPLTLPFEDAGDAVDITPRNDLLRPEVVIRYVQPNQVDGQPCTQYIIDAAPGGANGLAFGALVATVRLAGGNATFEKQPVKTEPIPTADTDSDTTAGWLQRHVPWLANFTADRLQVSDVSASVTPDPGPTTPPNTDSNTEDYPNELLSGSIPDWMKTGYYHIITGRVTVTCTVSYQYPEEDDAESDEAYLIFGPDEGNLDNWDNNMPLEIMVRGTNAVTKTYEQLSTYDQPEAAPTGMAGALYSALSRLQYEGTWNVIQPEVSNTTRLGVALNLVGGRAEWAAMNALVQEIADDLDNGITTYKFGPAMHLTIQDLMEQLRATRRRTESHHIQEREKGTPSAPSVDGGGTTAHNAGGAPPTPTHYPWIDFIDEQDDDNGDGITWDALLGYGQASFSGSDGIDHAGPLEKFEVSVGNDGSGWDGSDAGLSDLEHDSASLYNGFSLICGDDTAINDQLLMGRSDPDGNGGSIIITPFNQSIALSPNLDGSYDPTSDQFINISSSDSVIEIQNTDTEGETEPYLIKLDASVPSLAITMPAGAQGDSSSTLTAYSLDLTANSPTGTTISIDASEILQGISITKGSYFIDFDIIDFPSLVMSRGEGFNTILEPGDLQIAYTDGSASTLSWNSLYLLDYPSAGTIDLDASEIGGKAMYCQSVTDWVNPMQQRYVLCSDAFTP